MKTLGSELIREHGSHEQKWRVFKAERLRIGHVFTRLVVQAEICDKLNPASADRNISPSRLLQFCDEVADTESENDRYALLTERVAASDPNDQRIWFDAIEGLTNPLIIGAVAKAAKELLPKRQVRWARVADMGAGTGRLAALLAENHENGTAQQVVALDRVPALASVVAERNGPEVQAITGDALNTPFPPASFDLVTSGGLVYMLGHEYQTDYFTEVNRLLKPGGVYLDGDQHKWEGTTPNWGRFQLTSFIQARLAGRELLGDPLASVDQPAYFGQLGFDFSERHYDDDPPYNPIVVRVLQKMSDPAPNPPVVPDPWHLMVA